MDTTGVRLVLQALHRAEESGAEFALIRGPYEVQHVLELVGLTEQLRIVAEPCGLERLSRPVPVRPITPPSVPVSAPARDRVRPGAADLLGAIGNTPLVELTHLAPGSRVRLWAKLESLNPTGSVKDRVAKALIEDAEARDAIRPGQTILEPTSGNTGISLAMICARKGYPLKVVMPDNVTPERTQILRMYGAEIAYSPGDRGSNGAVETALAMAAEDPGYYVPYQYGNAANPLTHYTGTGPEILSEIGSVAAFVAGLGTGGTLMGTGRRLREELGSAVKLVAVEPMPGELVQGLRSLDDGFIPPIIDLSLLDRKIFVSNHDAIAWTRRLLDEEGIFAGVSSGAIASVAVRIARELDGGNVVFMICDDGWKYFSSGLYTRPLDQVVGVDSTAWW
jgi:[CysO sulfur-carrier protein]-thiocarboxylate-dependent cysteine synthase